MIRFILAVTGVLAAVSSIGDEGRPALPPDATLIRGARVFDGERAIGREEVLIAGGRIAAVGRRVAAPPGATIVDGAGKTLMPGLIDGHVHMTDGGETGRVLGLRQASLYGITTVMEMGTSDPVVYTAFKARVHAGDYPGAADLFSAGPPATAPGGHGDMRHLNPTLTAPDEAEQWVADRVAAGSDYIKLISETFAEHGRNVPTLSDATFAAVVAAAHRHDRIAVAHTLETKRARMAVMAGIDGLVHISPYNPPDPDFGTLLAAHHVFQSTNMISYAPAAFKNDLAADPALRRLMPDYMIDGLEHVRPFADANHAYSIAALRQLIAAHVPIIAGTDIGYPYAPLLDGELAIMVRDGGMTPTEALRTVTGTPARVYRQLADRGRIAPGLRADLVLVDGDPTSDIAAIRHIAAVWERGVRVDREAIVAAVKAAPVPPPMGAPPPASPPAR